VFRVREPEAARPYRMWGYPFVPAVFVVVAAALLCYTFKNDWPNSGYGVLVILAGIPLFAIFAHLRRRAQSTSS
jgi:APA family basic amino acid/polyamine antiporter